MNPYKQLVKFQMDDGSPVYVEIDQIPGGQQLVANRPGEVAQAQSKFTEALSYLQPAAKAVFATLQDINHPDEINLEFGIKLDGKIGAILASSTVEANFKVSLTWKNEKSGNTP